MVSQSVIVKNTMKELKQSQSSFANKKKKEALDKFNSMPMPNKKEEEWKYSKIEELKLENFKPFKSKVKVYANELGGDLIEKGVIFTDINTAFGKYPKIQNYFFKSIKTEKDKFVVLNAAYFASGYFLYVPKNVDLGELKVKFDVNGKNSILHNLIIVDENSKLDFIEEYSNRSEKDQLNTAITEIYVNNNTKINFYHLNNWTKNIYNFTNIMGTAERNATINWFSGCFGGKINRLRIDTNLNGLDAKSNNIGIFIGKNKEHIDITTNAYHNVENTTNEILIDGILKDESTSVYRGLIKIEKKAQKTNSYLANHILKLSDKTVANSIPSLKIDANDVKASHEATIGKVDEEHLFYLMSRGLSREEAEKMIVEGFFEPIIQKISSEELKESIRESIKK